MSRQPTDSNFFRSYHFPVRGKSAKANKRSVNDSVWALILSFQKNFPSYKLHEILDELTLDDVIMYQRATPLYDDEKEEEWDEGLDANDPDNFATSEYEEFVI